MRLLLYIFSAGAKQVYFRLVLLVAFLCVANPFVSFAQRPDPILKTGQYLPRLTGLYSSKQSLPSPNNTDDTENYFPEKFPLDKNHCKEDISKRTPTSRTYQSDDGQIVVENSLANINYYDKNKELQPLTPNLYPALNGWMGKRQEFPTYLHPDGSTELTLYEHTFSFNKNCRINNQPINMTDYTVGVEGMYAHEVYPSVDKKIVFFENMIETDYIIQQPIASNGQDIVFSEEINLPAGYTIVKNPKPVQFKKDGVPMVKEDELDEYIVVDAEKRVQSQLKTPVYYDKKYKSIAGKYEVVTENNKTILKYVVPASWLNDASRVYPVTIDPVVFGPYSWYPPQFGPYSYPTGWLPSCQAPNWSSDSMLITIPANVTVTHVITWDSYYADVVNGILMTWGAMYMNTTCGNTPSMVAGGIGSNLSGWAFLDSVDLATYLGCCFPPSCSPQSSYVYHHFQRVITLGPGCNLTMIGYSPASNWKFHCFFIGRTVETSQSNGWFVFPSPVCSDTCNVKLRVISNYGVPPYTLTHPWAAGSLTYGTATGGCNSHGTDTISLTIPGCPTYCGVNSTLSVPPPHITDVCGDTVAGLSPKNITIHPAPDAQASNVTVCAGMPISIAVTSCVPTATFTWTGSDASSGTGNISNTNTSVPGVITYTATPTANGCAGAPAIVTATIANQPTASAVASGNFICGGIPITITGSGGPPYQWSGGSTATTASITVTPMLTTAYYLTVGSGSCTDSASVIIQVDSMPLPTVAGNQVICEGQSTTLVATGASTYLWSGGVNSTNATVTVSPVLTTTYYVTGTTSCGSSVDTAVVTVNPIPNVYTGNTDTTITAGITLQLSSFGGNSYIWSGDGLSCTACPAPIAQPLTTTTYTLTGTDVNGCSSTDYFTVTVLPGEDILYIPNTITPDENDKNDVFYAYGINIKHLQMQVFDRWGELIFESNDKSIGWNGMQNGDYVGMGVYVYVIRCDFNDGTSVKRIGNINVIY